MKHLFNLLGVMVVVTASLFTITSCSDDDPATVSGDPTIAVTTAVNEAAPGGKLTITVAATAPGTLKSVTVDDVEAKAYTSGSADAFVYDYTIPAVAALGKKTLTFKVTDAGSKTATTTLDIVVGKEVVVVDKAISASTTWSASKKYLLKSNIYVQAPAELTIEAGTIVKGDKVSKGALIINRGAKIHAKGTEANPIIFTSSAPANFRNYGDWGGLVLLGFANNNQGTSVKIEGVSTEGSEDGFHGNKDNGSHEDDNSGELQYVRVEFAGIALSTDNELNGLTMGSVGNKTTIDHVQVSYSGDDSYEWFGGSVNAKYLIAYRGWDDDFDTDNGFSGRVQFGVSHRDPNIADKSGSNGFESDNDAAGDALTPITSAKFSNMTWYGPGVYAAYKAGAINKSNYNQNFQYGAHIRRNTAVQIYNTVFVGSYLDGINFENANAGATVQGCYFARMGVNVSNSVMKTPTGTYDFSYFAGANEIEATQNTVDLTSRIVKLGVTANDKKENLANIDSPLSLLAAGSGLLNNTHLLDLTANGFDATTYIGAFDATNDWTSKSWVNFKPNATDY